MSFIAVKSDDWPGWTGITALQVFGDSYSSVGYTSDSPEPSELNPLGVPFPGIPKPVLHTPFSLPRHLWTDNGSANWVGHIIQKVKPRSLLAHVYAFGGASVFDLQEQVQQGFFETSKSNSPMKEKSSQPTERVDDRSAVAFYKTTLFGPSNFLACFISVALSS